MNVCLRAGPRSHLLRVYILGIIGLEFFCVSCSSPFCSQRSRCPILHIVKMQCRGPEVWQSPSVSWPRSRCTMAFPFWTRSSRSGRCFCRLFFGVFWSVPALFLAQWPPSPRSVFPLSPLWPWPFLFSLLLLVALLHFASPLSRFRTIADGSDGRVAGCPGHCNPPQSHLIRMMVVVHGDFRLRLNSRCHVGWPCWLLSRSCIFSCVLSLFLRAVLPTLSFGALSLSLSFGIGSGNQPCFSGGFSRVFSRSDKDKTLSVFVFCFSLGSGYLRFSEVRAPRIGRSELSSLQVWSETPSEYVKGC